MIGPLGRKHVIVLVVDAFCHDVLKRRVGQKPVTPFLRRASEAGRSWDGVYSLAPYTEASLVSLLGRENTLNGGGYLFGNAVCTEPLPLLFQHAGYKTSVVYSPYVYSKAYLRGVDNPVHTRLFDIRPLFNYRLLQLSRILNSEGNPRSALVSSAVLLKEGMETWLEQIESLIGSSESTRLVSSLVHPSTDLSEINCALRAEFDLFEKDPLDYTNHILASADDNLLLRLNARYRKVCDFRIPTKELQEAKLKLSAYQKSYTKALRKTKPDLGYLLNTLTSGSEGWAHFKGLAHNYMRLYGNTYLNDYFETIEAEPKQEVSLSRQCDYFLENIRQGDSQGVNTFAYIHAQDFHLPSVFHTTDCRDPQRFSEDMSFAYELLDGVSGSCDGNVLADLSARYCDALLKRFVYDLDSLVPNRYTLVVTADHGYPSFFNPPRPQIYNQTYSEAFHVPFFVFGGNVEKSLLPAKNEIVSNLAMLDQLWHCLGVNPRAKKASCKDRYIISEYGGPGCPNLQAQPIWYTYIDSNYRISARCMLGESFSSAEITDVFFRNEDPDEKYNKRKSHKSSKTVSERIARIAARHDELSSALHSDDFLSSFATNHFVRADIANLGLDG